MVKCLFLCFALMLSVFVQADVVASKQTFKLKYGNEVKPEVYPALSTARGVADKIVNTCKCPVDVIPSTIRLSYVPPASSSSSSSKSSVSTSSSSSAASSVPSVAARGTLTWTAPQLRVDGTAFDPATELDYYSLMIGNDEIRIQPTVLKMSYIIDLPPAGTPITIAAVDKDGLKSDYVAFT